MSKFKRLLYSASAFVASAPVLLAAEGGDSLSSDPIQWEGSTAKTIVDSSATTLKNFLSGAATVVAAVVIAGLAIWGGIALVGIIKRSFSVGKGR